MSTRIEGTTVVICRDDIAAKFPGGVGAFTDHLDEAAIRWEVGDASADNPTQVGEQLLSLGVSDGVETVLDLETGAQISTAVDTQLPSGTPLHDALIAALDAIGWSYYRSDSPAAFVDLPGKTGAYTTRFYANEPSDTLVGFTFAPLLVPLRARRRVLEFVARANHGLMQGSFELAFDSGALGVRTSLDARGQPLTDRRVFSMAWNGVAVLDRYTTQLMEVIYAKRNVREAIEEAEQS